MLKLALLVGAAAVLLPGCDTITPLGDQALQRGDLPTASGYYSAAAKRGEPGAAQKYAAVLQRQGRTAEASEVLRQAPPTPLTWIQQVEQLSAAGRCNEARQVVATSAPTNGSSAGVSAWITINCEKNLESAMPSLNLAARYGNDWARRTLAQNGRFVPASDLAQTTTPVQVAAPKQLDQSSSGDALVNVLGILLGGAAAGMANSPAPARAPSAAPTTTTCNAQRTTMGANIGMNQSYNVTCF